MGKLITYFVHPRLRDSIDEFWQAKVLIAAQLMLQIVGIFFLIFSEINDHSNYLYLWLLILANPVLLFLFKKQGNLLISGNLAVFAMSLFLIPMPYYTGGIYSDDMIWMLLVPIMAFTLTNFSSGLVWTIVLLAVHAVYFSLEPTDPTELLGKLAHWTPGFYYTSISLFFCSALMLIGAAKFGYRGIINEQHRNQKELSAKTQKLEELTSELREVEKILRDSNKELEQFAYVVSHDLKQPLRNINSFSALLERQLSKHYEIDSKTKEYLSFIKVGTVNMNQLIEDIITYSRAGARSELEEATVAMSDIEMLIVHNLRKQIEETNTTLVWQDMPDIVDFSKVQMVQLLQNLISNAIKYRRQSIDPVIIVACKDEFTHWEFSVQDNGSGISQEHINSVFGLFVKLEGTKQDGSGIGLATCKKIVENNRGEITLQSQVGVGSTFTFTVPRRKYIKPDGENRSYTESVLNPTALN